MLTPRSDITSVCVYTCACAMFVCVCAAWCELCGAVSPWCVVSVSTLPHLTVLLLALSASGPYCQISGKVRMTHFAG